MIEALLAVLALTLIVCWRGVCQASGGERHADQQLAQAKINHFLPEDAVLRRHVISLVHHEIEATLPPRPSDSVLLRHHQALLMTKLDQRLAELRHYRTC
ncbi:hypothetical protein JWZ98_05765 [Methylomonas sp. EFPC1]|uniref:hypothetical protein n=1 Tax=Methylomonas sp. EFPC1 TaxID=2812647 RepID=UPI001967310A|nr:hypothetical protein [Methylomonas sp. EFPC1]QSB02451.1 hypothetical protein JWZ98_05765 [Methylomonas sp. EFPC1]